MIELYVHFDRNVEASVLFDEATAVRMRTPFGVDPLDPALDIHEVIGQLHVLKEQALEFIGHVPGRLTVYRRPQLPAQVLERLEAAAFAAGFEQFDAVGLGDVAVALFPASRGKSLVLLHAARDRISGIVLSRDGRGAMVAVRDATEVLDEAAIGRRFLAALYRGPGAALVGRVGVVQELVDRYWETLDRNWSLDARGWGPEGWSAVCLSGTDAAEIDEVPTEALRKLLAELASATPVAEIAIIGEGRARLSALVGALMPNARVVASPVADLPAAMISLGRTRKRAASNQPLAERLLEMRLLFDPRIELGTNAMVLKRDNSAVRAVIEPGVSHQLEHIPAKWHRAGFDVEMLLAGKSTCVRLFKEQMSMDLRTFSARIDSRWTSDARLLLRISIPELEASVLVVAQAGRESVVAYYGANRPG